MNEIVTILDAVHAETLRKLDDSNCTEAYIDAISHEWSWLRSDILAEDDMDEVMAIINKNRHMARCLGDLEDARCPRVWIDATRRGFVEFRDKAKEVANV